MANPLNTITKKEAMKKQFTWTNECEKAFQELKNRVCEAPILRHFDPSKHSVRMLLSTNRINYETEL